MVAEAREERESLLIRAGDPSRKAGDELAEPPGLKTGCLERFLERCSPAVLEHRVEELARG